MDSTTSQVVCLKDLEDFALASLPRNALDYYRSGADHMQTLKENKSAFTKYYILPRMLVDVSQRDLSTRLLGGRFSASFPVGIAPTAMQRMAHPDGECATARAAQSRDTVYILSTISTSSIEEVAEAAPDATKWFQLYIMKDRKVTANLVRRAERAGFGALVLTVDAPIFGRRIADVRNRFQLPTHLRMANFVGLGEMETGVKGGKDSNSGISQYATSTFDPTLSWADVKWLQSITSLPVVVKGVLRPDDALRAAQAGVAAIIVSNHGARQIDGVPATIDALRAVKRAVGDRVEVYIDGGITQGTDVLKALALGADMVFVGRPVLWGLAYDGQKGVEKTLDILREELDRAMALTGCTSVDKIDEDVIMAPKALL